MTPDAPATLIIAAHEPSHTATLAEMVQSLRPNLRVRAFDPSAEAPEQSCIILVVEAIGEGFGKLSEEVRALHPTASLVMIAPRFDERAVEVAARVRVAAILPSPCEGGTMLRTLRAIERKVEFPGRISGVETGELLRLHAHASSNGILHVTGGGRSGAIHLDEGHPVHAHCGELRGAAAVTELLRIEAGEATWIEGNSACSRTILGRVDGLLERELGEDPVEPPAVAEAPRDVLMRIEHLASIDDILGAYLLRNTEVIMGRNDSSLDEVVISRALTRLALVFQDMEEQQGDRAGSEIQATVGDHRLVVDRMGPASLGFQIGVVVRQATPVCKSLRRLLRQIDRAFRRSLAAAESQGGSSGPGGRDASGVYRVA